jgi:hypothetical protein
MWPDVGIRRYLLLSAATFSPDYTGDDFTELFEGGFDLGIDRWHDSLTQRRRSAICASALILSQG